MKIILLLIILSLTVALFFLYAFFWAVKSGQYEDDYTPSVRILFDEQGAGQSDIQPSQKPTVRKNHK